MPCLRALIKLATQHDPVYPLLFLFLKKKDLLTAYRPRRIQVTRGLLSLLEARFALQRTVMLQRPRRLVLAQKVTRTAACIWPHHNHRPRTTRKGQLSTRAGERERRRRPGREAKKAGNGRKQRREIGQADEKQRGRTGGVSHGGRGDTVRDSRVRERGK